MYSNTPRGMGNSLGGTEAGEEYCIINEQFIPNIEKDYDF